MTDAPATAPTRAARGAKRPPPAFERAADDALNSRFLVLQKIGPTSFLIQRDTDTSVGTDGRAEDDDSDADGQDGGTSSSIVIHADEGRGIDLRDVSSSSSRADTGGVHGGTDTTGARRKASSSSNHKNTSARNIQKFKVCLGVPCHTCTCGTTGAGNHLDQANAPGGGSTGSASSGPSRSKPTSITTTQWCVHICYVLLKVLGVARDFPVAFQDRITEVELDQLLSYRDMMREAKFVREQKQKRREEMMQRIQNSRTGGGGAVAGTDAAHGGGTGSCGNIRPPQEDDQCPICFDDLLADDELTCKPVVNWERNFALTFCTEGCKQAVHTACMYKWCEHHKSDGATTCPLCRVPWSKEQILQLNKRYQRSLRQKKAQHPGMQCGFCKMRPIRGPLYGCLSSVSSGSTAKHDSATASSTVGRAGLGIVSNTRSAGGAATSLPTTLVYCEECFYNPLARASNSGRLFVKKATADQKSLELVQQCLPSAISASRPQQQRPQPSAVHQHFLPRGLEFQPSQQSSLSMLQEIVAANPEFQGVDELPLSVILALGHDVAEQRRSISIEDSFTLQTTQLQLHQQERQQAVGQSATSTSGASSWSRIAAATSSATAPEESQGQQVVAHSEERAAPGSGSPSIFAAIVTALATEPPCAGVQMLHPSGMEVRGARQPECVFCEDTTTVPRVQLPRCGHWCHGPQCVNSFQCPKCDTFLLRSLEVLCEDKKKANTSEGQANAMSGDAAAAAGLLAVQGQGQNSNVAAGSSEQDVALAGAAVAGAAPLRMNRSNHGIRIGRRKPRQAAPLEATRDGTGLRPADQNSDLDSWCLQPGLEDGFELTGERLQSERSLIDAETHEASVVSSSTSRRTANTQMMKGPKTGGRPRAGLPSKASFELSAEPLSDRDPIDAFLLENTAPHVRRTEDSEKQTLEESAFATPATSAGLFSTRGPGRPRARSSVLERKKMASSPEKLLPSRDETLAVARGEATSVGEGAGAQHVVQDNLDFTLMATTINKRKPVTPGSELVESTLNDKQPSSSSEKLQSSRRLRAKPSVGSSAVPTSKGKRKVNAATGRLLLGSTLQTAPRSGEQEFREAYPDSAVITQSDLLSLQGLGGASLAATLPDHRRRSTRPRS
ncbi:unnamed protein product [Amoebophrya sp. A120]|nr:unnamed protein product [Amoebophrya sp. A120]|eukprot:GSA120T00011735001.1